MADIRVFQIFGYLCMCFVSKLVKNWNIVHYRRIIFEPVSYIDRRYYCFIDTFPRFFVTNFLFKISVITLEIVDSERTGPNFLHQNKLSCFYFVDT